MPKPEGDIGTQTLYLASHLLTNLFINAGHTEIARRHGCASEGQIFPLGTNADGDADYRAH